MEPKQKLAQVTRPLAEDRGPDVRCAITVPDAWLRDGVSILVSLPRLATCAHCDGGGCDLCRSQGALSLRPPEAPPSILDVHLPCVESVQVQLIRIPERGARAWEGDGPRGCLLLEVKPGAEPSDGVKLAPTQAVLSQEWVRPGLTLAVVGAVLSLILMAYLAGNPM